ncbi:MULTISPECIES: helix-turn-helix domain-containing protein [Nocardia]|uniref:helix-turn-helix domain-containing protein n=1 Tax=Nocardia TaxID=1817 RepID=UPI000D695AD9|nr:MULTISPECIES: helix-turn-helix domain-containing protein [Nocardia]
MAEPLAYSFEAAAEAAGLHVRRIQDAVKRNELGYLKIGRAKVIKPEELKRWLYGHDPK